MVKKNLLACNQSEFDEIPEHFIAVCTKYNRLRNEELCVKMW